MIFFKPKPNFINWLIKYANGRTIVDIGCGEGYLVHLLSQKYDKVVGIEPFEPLFIENEKDILFKTPIDKIIPLLAQTTPHLKDNRFLIICCRPSHDGWLNDVLHNLKTEMLYIGLEKNIEDDLNNTPYKRLNVTETGDENEIVLSVDFQ